MALQEEQDHGQKPCPEDHAYNKREEKSKTPQGFICRSKTPEAPDTWDFAEIDTRTHLAINPDLNYLWIFGL